MTVTTTRLRHSDSILAARAGTMGLCPDWARATPRWNCAQCGHRGLRPSRLRHFEFLLYLLLMRPFRCPSCDRRVFRLFFGGSRPR